MTVEPQYPIGTPEYDEYAANLRAELAKFATGEPPYEYPVTATLANDESATLLACGCPAYIVADEGHQEGCDER